MCSFIFKPYTQTYRLEWPSIETSADQHRNRNRLDIGSVNLLVAKVNIAGRLTAHSHKRVEIA